MILVGGRVNPPRTRFDENDDCTGVYGWPGNGQGWTLWLLRCTTMNGRTDTGSGPKPCSRPGRYNCCIIADGLLVSTANSQWTGARNPAEEIPYQMWHHINVMGRGLYAAGN